MFERAKDEPITKFWFRQYIQDPFKVLSFGALCAIFWLYHDAQTQQSQHLSDLKAQSAAQMQDMRDQSAAQMQDMRDQNRILLERIESETKAMQAVANRLDSINVAVSGRLDLISNRLEHLEREHENIRRANNNPQ